MKKTLKGAVVLLIAITMIFSSAVMAANTKDKSNNEHGNIINIVEKLS